MNNTSVIWKFLVQVKERFALELPEGDYQPLAVQLQHGHPMIWISVNADPTAKKVKRGFLIIPTGLSFNPKHVVRYLGTFQQTPDLVFHLYEGCYDNSWAAAGL
jgi:hypothetical protein